MQLILDRKEQKALLAITQTAHDELNFELLTTDDDDSQQLYRLQIIDLAVMIDALEGTQAKRVKIKMSNDIGYLLGITAKQHLILWNDEGTEIVDKAGGSWYSVCSKLHHLMKDLISVPELQ